MNKQIEHLFNAAGFHKPEMERLGIEHKFEKFAELIVRECAKVSINNGCGDFVDIEQKLFEHFGVEE